jgi:hypothetical protein
MKWILLLGAVLLSNACVYRSTEIMQFRQVSVVPQTEHVILDVENPGPLDVSTTTIEYY